MTTLGELGVIGPLRTVDLIMTQGANLLVLIRRLASFSSDAEKRRELKDAVLRAAESQRPGSDELSRAVRQRRSEAVAGLRRQGFEVQEVKAAVSNKAVLGNTAESPLEFSLALHATYGWPVLPATGAKGAALAISGDKELFGSDTRQAEVFITDGLPVDVRLERDVMTPHYAKYYGDAEGAEPPAEWWEPNPVGFLAVAPRSVFSLHLISRAAADNDGDDPWASRAHRVVEKALEEEGLGGKTAAGYGYFSVELADGTPEVGG